MDAVERTLDVQLNHHRPNMALGGLTSKQRLAMAA